jgi:hypothetical protein
MEPYLAATDVIDWRHPEIARDEVSERKTLGFWPQVGVTAPPLPAGLCLTSTI